MPTVEKSSIAISSRRTFSLESLARLSSWIGVWRRILPTQIWQPTQLLAPIDPEMLAYSRVPEQSWALLPTCHQSKHVVKL